MAVSHLIQLERQHSRVASRLSHTDERYRRLCKLCLEAYHAPLKLDVDVQSAAEPWTELQGKRPLRRLDLAIELAQLCSPTLDDIRAIDTSLTPSPPTGLRLLRPGLIALAISLLPTPLTLISRRKGHGLRSLFDLIPAIYHMITTLLHLRFLIFIYRIAEGPALPLAALGEGKQDAAVERVAKALEGLQTGVDASPSPLLGQACLNLIKLRAAMGSLAEEERRLAVRAHDALLLALHRWREGFSGAAF